MAEGWRVAIVKDLAVAAREAGFPILREQTENTALWIMAEGIRREAVAALSHDVVLVDRAIFDALGYLEAALNVTVRPRSLERHAILEDIARAYVRDYDLLVITEMDAALPLGANRDDDAEFRAAAGQRIAVFANSLDQNLLTMNSNNRDEVERDVLTFIRRNLDAVAD